MHSTMPKFASGHGGSENVYGDIVHAAGTDVGAEDSNVNNERKIQKNFIRPKEATL